MLTEQECSLIERGLTEAVEPRKVAAYLSFHMGLMLAEVAGLRRCDIDLENGNLTLNHYIGKPEDAERSFDVDFLPFEKPRVLLMPPHVIRYIMQHEDLYTDDECFIMTGEKTIPAFYMMQNILTTVKLKYKVGSTLSMSDLRNAFIRRNIQASMDLYSLCDYIGIKQPNVILNRFREYFTPRYEAVRKLEKYSIDYVPEPEYDPDAPKQMNLLILGAGSQGPVVKEIAEAIGIFDEIAFLDDDPNNKLAIGPLKDMPKLKYRFPLMIPSFGDSFLRERYLSEIDRLGALAPSLIHPSVTLSPNAKLGRAVVIEARCIVSAGAVIGKGAILSSASVIESNATLGKFVHIGASSTAAKNAVINDYVRIPSGTVVRAE